MAEVTCEEQTAQLGRELVERFGPGISVEYLDIYAIEMAQYSDVIRLISRGDVPLPIISIDGKPRFAGGISSQVVGDALEKMGLAPVAAG